MMQLTKACSTVRSARYPASKVAKPTSATRSSIVPRASPSPPEDTNAGPAPPPGTIFYGGKAYTEAEYQVAVNNGTVVQAAPAPAPSATQPSFGDIMNFGGSAPELVNGRLAMLGFIAAVGAELSSGESVLRQLADEPTGIIAIFGLIIAASLVPAFKGTKNTESFGPLSPNAEMTNGRGAMIGFAAMLVIEAVSDKALF